MGVTTPDVQMTHLSGMIPTTSWARWPEIFPAVSDAVGRVMQVFCPLLQHQKGPPALIWGIDVAIDVEQRPFILEINTAPEMTYPLEHARWQSAIDSMLDDFLSFFVIPWLSGRQTASRS